jgi:hypothetical protein
VRWSLTRTQLQTRHALLLPSLLLLLLLPSLLPSLLLLLLLLPR